MTHAAEAITWHTETTQDLVDKALALLGTYVTAAAWDDETTYAKDAQVSHDGIIYTSLQANNLNKAPATQAAWWTATDKADATWGQVVMFPGTSIEDLFQFIPALTLPAAVVAYRGSQYANQPRRTVGLGVLVVVQSFAESDLAHDWVDQACRQLDHQLLNEGLFLVQEDTPIDLGPGISAVLLSVDVEDH
jgi:hypothetical protein